MGTRLLKLVVAAIVAGTLVVTAWPQFFGLEQQAPFAQLLSFRLVTALFALVAASVLLLIALLARSVRRFALLLAAMGLLFAVVVSGGQYLKGFASGELRPQRLADVRVLSWNLTRDSVRAENVTALALDRHVDVIALQGTTPETATAVSDALDTAGRPMTLLMNNDLHDPTLGSALLISTALGEYTIDESSQLTSVLPSVVARPSGQDAPVFVSAHVIAPTQSAMRAWRSDLTRLTALCSAEDDVVIVGDTNSTIERWSALPGSADLGDCVDAGNAAGAGAVATWPSGVPSMLGAAIDHVAYSGRWKVSGYEVLMESDRDESDHRPVIVQLSVERMQKIFR